MVSPGSPTPTWVGLTIRRSTRKRSTMAAVPSRVIGVGSASVAIISMGLSVLPFLDGNLR